jgi:hypothetical protein
MEELKILIKKAIDDDFNEIIISQIVFLYYKNDKKNIDKIRIGISEEIFELFMNFADENKEMYDKIHELCLKLKDAKFKDKVMKHYIIKNKSQ